MSDFQDKLRAFCSRRDARGCSNEDLARLALQCSVPLPETYRQFMQIAGKGVDDFLSGSDFTLEDLDGMRDAANELLAGAGLAPLPPEAFVFTMHQGYQFFFFLNECVYYYVEGASEPEKRFESFEEFFDAILAEIEFYRLRRMERRQSGRQ